MKCDWGRGLGAFVQVDELAAFVLHGDGSGWCERVEVLVFSCDAVRCGSIQGESRSSFEIVRARSVRAKAAESRHFFA